MPAATASPPPLTSPASASPTWPSVSPPGVVPETTPPTSLTHGSVFEMYLEADLFQQLAPGLEIEFFHS